MTRQELARSAWQYLAPCGVIRDGDGVPALYTRGVNGGDAFVVAITVNDSTFHRHDGESWDALLARVRNDLIARGDPANIATCIYDPPIEPREVKNIQPRFRERMTGR